MPPPFLGEGGGAKLLHRVFPLVCTDGCGEPLARRAYNKYSNLDIQHTNSPFGQVLLVSTTGPLPYLVMTAFGNGTGLIIIHMHL